MSDTQPSRDPDIQPSPAGVPGAVTEADLDALTGEELTFPGADGVDVNGYLARPQAGAARPGAGRRYPAMVVIHEAGGLGEHIRDVCLRFAKLGYVALGVDLYTREGGPPPAGDMPKIMARLFSMSDATALGDLEGAADLLRSRPDVTGRVGCIGFCMGGRYALLFACSSDRLDAAVDCWGGFIDTANGRERTTEPRPTPPLELAERVCCPLYAAIGAEDHNPSPEVGERLRAALASSPHETAVEVYEGAGHAFFANHRPTYRPEPAHRLWENIVPFLERHLSG